ncbi:GFA family protein [archaeon]|nr:MAG: GFA family protein [archaeon]
MADEVVTHEGQCHCGAVRFTAEASPHLLVWDCNCSICKMKRNTHFVVPQSAFRLLSGSEELTEYRFNTKVAVHMFCRICGVQPFYRPRSNPDGVAITAACITSPTVASITVKSFDGCVARAHDANAHV